MGNQQSNSRPTSNSPVNVTASHGHHHHQHQHPHQQNQHHEQRPQSHVQHVHNIHHGARRRDSIPALTVKAQAAPPSASLHHAESHPTSTRPHSRGRSQTTVATTTVVANQLRAAQDNYKPAVTEPSAMGNEQSSQKGQKDKHLPRDFTPPTQSATSTPPPEKVQQQQQQQQTPPTAAFPQSPPPSQPQPAPSPHTQPVNCPGTAPREDAQTTYPTTQRDRELELETLIDPASASQQDYIVPSSHFSRPPRLPLPIEEEDHRPGSPILAPQDDVSSPIDHDEVEGTLPRHASILSDKTADDDDLGDEFKGPNTGRPTVPTIIEWEGPGERVYVTGTFAGWNRKYRLHRNGPSKKKDALSAYVHITPGTHHLMFIVDNDMRTSDHLPTAVDYTNILVNYLEVSPDDLPQPVSSVPSQTDQQAADAAKPVQDREKPTGVYPPQVLPDASAQAPKAPVPEPTKPKAAEPTKRYHQNIPRYLLDLDAPEESSRFARANATTNNLPTPPTLPGFLGKSILNGTTPHKDDSSVLIMPNHTVLNHLATSSIKDNILATSATTRYRQKFLTTIMYKPKEEDPDRY